MPGPEDATRLNDAPAPARWVSDTDASNATSTTAASLPAASIVRYVLGEEVARGGMGVVYRATDTTLGREVAVKVLQERFGPGSPAARRFDDEARITAQLQHPNIPAVHDLGVLPDGRPFLAMRLIKGDTLEAMLAARPAPSADRGRFVAAFEQVCQAVAYAHAHGVIHRDLKPANVMVGSFAQVQVMDWGLAKVLAGAEAGGDPQATTGETEVRSLRDGAFTQAGSVLGTPAFMPPEQAAGAVGKVDARSDVFGLGAILAVILTGQPPFAAGSAETSRVRAAQGDVADCLARLDTCGAEPDLVALCKRCLSPKPADRPADAGEVARAVAGLRAAADERARRAELDRAEAVVREAEQRERRKVWLGLAGALAAGLAVAAALAVWADRARRMAEAAEQQAEDARGKEAQQRREAEAQTKLANAVKDFLKYDVLRLADPATQQRDRRLAYDADVKLRDVVLRASRAIEGKFADRPLVEAELRWTLGHALWGMGRADLAAPHFERTLALQRERLGPGHPDTLASMSNLANSYAALGRHPEALKLHEQTLALRREKLGPDHPDTLNSALGVVASLVALKKPDEALPRLDETLTLADQAAAGGKPPDPRLKPALISLRVQIFASRRDAAACRHSDEKLPLRSAGGLYDAACWRAVLAGLSSGDTAKAEADRAMAWLHKAVAAGYNDRAHMEKDADLDALRGREDFQALMRQLAAKPELLRMPRKE
ncbi:MAG: serine/threonine-protein kinase [Gemmataceae bacterium]